ncbi:GNAT family N-acetyltransferase [Reichenbachiella carrageenanivorans]|uniref:GNAT family N-acetyltransferase n=1 Tax=Reichenbachiella carrageenanivorans TaxID=2979869 RepID=A0ABY6D2N4_9BACT|nr:GNAT family N-acetyltransferase [Reichenbachiella carrageenanivorans]UXX80417.1 GNAT family N-acetyltransferase [Reichenbachiella carrageenanivorans]
MKIQIKKFRQLTLDELYTILKIRVDAFVVEQNCPYPEIDQKDQEATHFFICQQNEIVSYLRVYYRLPTDAAVGRVVTPPAFRGQGLSRALIQAAIVEIKKEGKAESIYLQAQEHLSPFYATFGFEKTSDIYLEDGIPHVDMSLSILN